MRTTDLSGQALAITDDTFAEDVLNQHVPVLVDFWAEWCPPCHMLAPTLDQIARERAGSLLIRKINNDENPVTGASYRVLSLPTLILFRDGEVVHTVVGARPKARLLAEIDDALRRPI
ncbi:thioredoxin [Phytoactinopolyspora halotolerans]|uniref:Thioredoxin n=1 Tax=Phytoactinopolyspora halotolerans TaxID=1981512 RepID=A0A6L9SF02_9ACTN|nr:thioredoxin [Phytoactinopolyspora halotolerans]NEE03816.1 thioredoxin [Phytoactinopolyspora halotolerans]